MNKILARKVCFLCSGQMDGVNILVGRFLECQFVLKKLLVNQTYVGYELSIEIRYFHRNERQRLATVELKLFLGRSTTRFPVKLRDAF